MKKINISLLFFILIIPIILCNSKGYDNNLCLSNEKILISFQMINSKKILSVCLSKSNPDYIIYRFGTKENIELEFPDDLSNSWNFFVYSYYLRGGGEENEGLDLNYLKFKTTKFEYQIYQEYYSQDNKTDIGIRIKNINTQKEWDLKGNISTLKGSLIDLRDNDKIKIE
jgi:hypothetical protein